MKGKSGLASFPWSGEPAPEAAAAAAAAKKSFWGSKPADQTVAVAIATPNAVAVSFEGSTTPTSAAMPLWVEARVVKAKRAGSAPVGKATAICTPTGGDLQPEPEPAQVWNYKTLNSCVVRSGVSKDSEEVGRLDKGQIIEVVEIAAQADGVVRVRFDRGWTSVTTKQGKKLLELLE